MNTKPAIIPNFDVEALRSEFPILSREINGKPLVFLDSAASAQKPRVVLESLRKTYEEEYANVHRGVYHLRARATRNLEEAREKVARFLNALSAREIVFSRSATEAYAKS